MENCGFCLESESKSKILGETTDTISFWINASLIIKSRKLSVIQKRAEEQRLILK